MPDDMTEITVDNKKGDYKVFNNGLDEVQAHPFGYIEDPENKETIKLSPLHVAEQGFKRLINHSATYDVSIACHGFLQKFIYAKSCDYSMEDDGVTMNCLDGMIGEKACPSCKGSGMQVHASRSEEHTSELQSRGHI